MLLRTLSKKHNFVKKTKNYLKKNKWSREITSKFLRRRNRRNVRWACGCLCQNLGITTYTLENYSNFKNKFLFNNGSILEINYYYSNKSRGNVSFTELSEIINTLSSQDFAGMDKFRLRASWGKIKKMRVKMNKTINVREMTVA